MVKDSDSCLANPKYTQWILEAIHKIKKQKQRPSEDRICNAVRSGRGISQALVQEQLELSVRDGNILRVFNKGIASYRDPDGGGSGSGTPSAKGGKIGKSTNLLKLVETAIQELAEGGSSLKSIEKYIRQSHRLEQNSASESELDTQLRLAVKKGVNSGRLGKDGCVYRIKELSDPPVKKGGKEDGTKTPGNDGAAATTTSEASKVSATLLFNLSNLLKLVETAIQELAEGGSSLKSIEKYIRQSHRLEQNSASESELDTQLRLAVKKGVNSGRLGKDGCVYRIKELSDPPVKKGGKEDGTKTPGNDGVAATTTSKASKVSATLLFNYGKASCSSLHYHNLSLVLTRGKLVYFLGHF